MEILTFFNVSMGRFFLHKVFGIWAFKVILVDYEPVVNDDFEMVYPEPLCICEKSKVVLGCFLFEIRGEGKNEHTFTKR